MKPTIIVADLSLCSRAYLLNQLFPTLYHLSKFLESKRYPFCINFCIKLVFNEIIIVRSLDRKPLSRYQINLLIEKI